MPSTSHPEFNASTEALEVARAFADGIRGKTVVITGVNRNGLGFTTAQAFASQSPAHLIICGRNMSKAQESIDALKTEYPDVDYRFLKLDLSSQKSVRTAAAELLAWADVPAINILVNSAGVGLIPERTLSEDGIEMQFATNQIGHFLFTCLIMPKLIKAAEGSPRGATRIVNVTTGAPTVAYMRWSDTNFEVKNKDLPADEQPNYAMLKMWGLADVEEQAYTPVEGYNQSKVAILLCSIAETKRLYAQHGILAVGVHPGVVQTELMRSAPPAIMSAVKTLTQTAFKYKSLAAGSSTSLVAALDPQLGPGVPKDGKDNYGAFLVDCQVSNLAHPLAVSSEQAEKLWAMSEKLVGEKFSW